MDSKNDEHARPTKKVKPTPLNLWVMGQVFSTLRLTPEGRAAMPARTEGNAETQ